MPERASEPVRVMTRHHRHRENWQPERASELVRVMTCLAFSKVLALRPKGHPNRFGYLRVNLIVSLPDFPLCCLKISCNKLVKRISLADSLQSVPSESLWRNPVFQEAPLAVSERALNNQGNDYAEIQANDG